MYIKEVMEKTGLTRKAILYYESKGLINPVYEENNYREFSAKDVEKLKLISILKETGMDIITIGRVINGEENLKTALEKIKGKHKMYLQKVQIISNLKEDNIDDVRKKLNRLQLSETLLHRIKQVFPGYFGKMIAYHYGYFLNEKELNEEKSKIFEELIHALDEMDEPELSISSKKFLDEAEKLIDENMMKKFNDDKIKGIENFDEFWEKSEEFIKEYENYKKSEEYLKSDICKFNEEIREYIEKNNYYEKVIPKLRKISPEYNSYYEKLLYADEKYRSYHRG